MEVAVLEVEEVIVGIIMALEALMIVLECSFVTNLMGQH